MARPKGSTNKPKEEVQSVSSNNLYIENLPEVMTKVKELIAEKEYNPDVVQEDEAGVAYIEGEPKMIIDNNYLPIKEATLILQTRKVVREYIKLQNLINNVI
jgi:hypothetical protein